jgi:ATP-dependent Clp protease ATP-binding subunit ClpC
MLHLKQTGFDERYGARPLQRAIEDEVTAPLANWLLNHPNTQNCTLEIDYDEVLKVNIA